MPQFLSWPNTISTNTIIETINSMLFHVGCTTPHISAMSMKAVRYSPDLIFIHWPDQIFWGSPNHWRLLLRAVRVIGTLTVFRVRGVRVVWIVHNLAPHDLSRGRAVFWKWYVRILAKLTSGWLTLSPSTSDEVTKMIPDLQRRPSSFIWHPPYQWNTPANGQQARATLGFQNDQLLFGHVGLLRPYKGLADFAELFAQHHRHNEHLVLAGMIKNEDYKKHLEKICLHNDSIDLRMGELEFHLYNLYLEALDIFIAPYHNFLHSGAMIHALSRGCIVLTRDSVFARDLERAVGSNWVIRFRGEMDSKVLRTARARVRQSGERTPNLAVLQPDANLGRLRDFLERLGVELDKPSAPRVLGQRSRESG